MGDNDYRSRTQKRAAGDWTRATDAQCKAPGHRRITRPDFEKGPATSMSAVEFMRVRRREARRLVRLVEALGPDALPPFERVAFEAAQRELAR